MIAAPLAAAPARPLAGLSVTELSFGGAAIGNLFTEVDDQDARLPRSTPPGTAASGPLTPRRTTAWACPNGASATRCGTGHGPST